MSTVCVFHVDPNEEARSSTSRAFESCGINLLSFSSAERFTSVWKASQYREKPSVVLFDLDARKSAALAAFDDIRLVGLPSYNKILFLSVRAEHAVVVELMRGGAFDFIIKPCSNEALVARVAAASFEAELQHGRHLDSVKYPDILTKREREIANLILQGLGNKEIAERVSLSPRTVEVHRAKMFEKLDVRNIVAFVRRLIGETSLAHGVPGCSNTFEGRSRPRRS